MRKSKLTKKPHASPPADTSTSPTNLSPRSERYPRTNQPNNYVRLPPSLRLGDIFDLRRL